MYSPPTLRASYKTAGLITGGMPSVSASAPSQIQQQAPKYQLPALQVPKTDLKESAPAQSLIEKGAGLLEQYSIEPYLASSRSQYGLSKPAAGTFGGWVDPEGGGGGDGAGSPGPSGASAPSGDQAFGDVSTSFGQSIANVAQSNPIGLAVSTIASIALGVIGDAMADADNAAASNSATANGVGNPNGALGDSVAAQAEAASPASQAANAAAQAAAVANNAVADADAAPEGGTPGGTPGDGAPGGAPGSGPGAGDGTGPGPGPGPGEGDGNAGGEGGNGDGF